MQSLVTPISSEHTDAQVVQFIHQSVKDFFVEKSLPALNGKITPAEAAIRAHFRFSRICVRYLAMEEIGRSTSYEDDDFPFLRYATTSWVAHTGQCDAGSVPQDDILALFAWPSNALVESWVRVYQTIGRYSDDGPPKGISLVYVTSRYGVFGLLMAILKRADRGTVDVDAKDRSGRTLLSWAAQNGHEAVVKLLLATGKVERVGRGKRSRLDLKSWTTGSSALLRSFSGRGIPPGFLLTSWLRWCG